MNTEPKSCPCYRESIIKAWNALPRRLQWTKEKPKDKGFYFLHRNGKSTIAWVVPNDSFVVLCKEGEIIDLNTIDQSTHKWAGPIEEPKP